MYIRGIRQFLNDNNRPEGIRAFGFIDHLSKVDDSARASAVAATRITWIVSVILSLNRIAIQYRLRSFELTLALIFRYILTEFLTVFLTFRITFLSVISVHRSYYSQSLSVNHFEEIFNLLGDIIGDSKQSTSLNEKIQISFPNSVKQFQQVSSLSSVNSYVIYISVHNYPLQRILSTISVSNIVTSLADCKISLKMDYPYYQIIYHILTRQPVAMLDSPNETFSGNCYAQCMTDMVGFVGFSSAKVVFYKRICYAIGRFLKYCLIAYRSGTLFLCLLKILRKLHIALY